MKGTVNWATGRGAVFLDKDGTLVEDVPYNVAPGLMRLTPGAVEGLRLLGGANVPLVVVTNQSGIARGLYSEDSLRRVEARLRDLVAGCGATLAGFYYCPHLPDGSVPPYSVECACRKPRTGMLRLAASDLGLDLGRSWMVGDILDDVQAGNAAGCRTVLLDNGGETRWELTPARTPDHLAADLWEAAEIVLSHACLVGDATGGRGWRT